MNSTQAFIKLVNATLLADKSRRYVSLISMKKGQRKLLGELSHHFETAIRPDKVIRKASPHILETPA